MSVIGLRVGPYEIAEPAHLPGPGDWYVAHHTGAKRRQASEVLVRLLPPDADDRARAGLQRQFEALKALEDPRIPAAVAFYEGSGALVVARVQGTPLREAIAGRADETIVMTPATLLDVMLELADTLQRVHHRERLHGRLDPDRVLLGADGALWILGFGDEQAAIDARWTPPELARGEAPTPATDQWSLAALATALVSGQAPWGSPDRAAEGDPEPIVGPVEQQWPALARVLRRMLDPDPAARHPSLQPARQELLALARKAGGTSERRELGASLSRRTPAEPSPDPDEEPAIEAEVPASELPTHPIHEPPAPEAEAEAEAETVDLAPARQRRPPQAPLPAEEIPVVRPDVDPDEVPVAHHVLDASQQADLEPSERTVLFPEAALEAALAAVVDPEDDDEEDEEDPDDEATVLARDLSAFGLGGSAPTAVPVTDSGEDDVQVDAESLGVSGRPSTGAEWFADEPRAETPADEPSLGLDPDEVETARRAPEAGPPPPDLPALRRAIPILLLLLGGLLVVWAAVRFL